MKIALTFDDGPNPMATPRLLEVLQKHEVKATFFMVGKWVKECPRLVKQVMGAGHKIGNHTQTHPKLTEIPMEQVTNEIETCSYNIRYITGAEPEMFRPPHILHNEQIDREVERCGLRTVLYQAAAGDAGEPRTPEQFEEKIVRELQGESGIVLMHDGFNEWLGINRDSTIETTERLIIRYKAAGADFVFPEETDGSSIL
jgi:peptidoglycan-N-acetylglucosamine deacetylase